MSITLLIVLFAGITTRLLIKKVKALMVKSMLTLSSAARYLDMPRSTLRYWVLTGNVRKRVVGGVWFVDPEEAKTVKENSGYRLRKRVAVNA